MADLEGLMRYAAVNDETDAELLEECRIAAILTLENAGVPEMADSRLYDLACYRIATYYFDQRSMGERAEAPIPAGLQGIIHQLRYTPAANG